MEISIRAPAKGATILSILFFPFYDISIRAPAKGATNCAWATEWSEWNFNPRSREGSDCLNRSISLTLIPFQSALPRRERPEEWQAVDALAKFQSALPRRERQKNTVLPQKISNFNPRSREGSDTPSKDGKDNDDISIRAPAKGATLHSDMFPHTIPISIRAPAKGATIL